MSLKVCQWLLNHSRGINRRIIVALNIGVKFVENFSPPKMPTCSCVSQAVPVLTTMEGSFQNMKGKLSQSQHN